MKDRLLIGLLLGAVVLIYGNTLVNGFVMDDELYITHNAQVVDPSFHRIFTPNPFSNVFRPITFSTLALNWAMGGNDPAGYHLLNLLLHAAATLLLFFLLRELFGSSQEAKSIAFAAALLYAVHPIHTEAVAWAVGRSELLAAGFLFAGWLLHLRDRPLPALGCFALAMLSKESAVVFLPLIAAGDYAIGKWKPRVQYALMAGLTVFYVGLLWKMQGGQFGQEGTSPVDNPLAAMPAGWRILNAVRVAWKYFALQVYPAALSCDYSFNQLPVFRDWRHTLPAALAAVAAVSAWIWALQKKKAGWAIAGAIYFAGFAVTANILMPTGTILGERLAYLPSAGFCLLLALGWNWIREKKETAAWALLAAFALLLSARTVMRNRDWQDALALFSSGVQAAPNDAKMHANLAGQYFIRNQLDQAALEYQTALRIVPDSPDTLAAYAALEFQQGHLEAAGGMMEKALRLSDRNFLNYDFMVVTYAAILRKTNRADRALESLNQETKESPWYAPAWSERAELHVQRGELDAGRADAEMGLRLNPQDAQAQYVLQLLNASAKSPAAAPQH